MHCLAGLDTLTSGHVSCASATRVDLGALNDRQLTRVRRERIGFVFQAFNLLPTLTRQGEHHPAADLAGRRPDKRVGRPRRRHRRARGPACKHRP